MGMTAKQLVNQALQELGLPQVLTVVSQPDDQTGFQSLGQLNALGTQLVRVHDWEFLLDQANIVGDGINDTFDLPSNYSRNVNQTQWALNTKRPMYGPISPQGWAWLQYGIVSVGVYFRYRIVGNKFQIFPKPGPGEQFAFFYIKKDWVIDSDPLHLGDPKPLVTLDDDINVFDDFLMIAGMKLKLWAAKGMETTVLAREFEYMLSSNKSQSAGAPVIALDRRYDTLYISGANIPDGSWAP